MSDANKTALTKRITECAALWLSQRGFKPVESEVPVANGWVADLAAPVSVTRTEAMKLELIVPTPDYRCMSRQEYTEHLNEREESYMAIPDPLTAIVEVKVSRSDFNRDEKWTRSPQSHLLYVAMPAELRCKVDVPPHVGLLVQHGQQLRCKRHATIREVGIRDVLDLIYAVAVRRDHQTSNERFREFNRQYREHDNNRINRDRFSTVFRVVMGLSEGEYESVEQALAWNGVRNKLPKEVMSRLQGMLCQTDGTRKRG